MTSKLNILLIALDNTDLSNTLTSISKQTFTNWELFIITFEKTDNISNIIKNKYQIIEINEKTSIFNFLLSFSSSLSGDFITLMANCDINDPKRFEKQISFMNSNNLNICSCLEASMNNNIYEKEALIESNKFIDSDNINSVISASYLPLDLYTFVLRKNFLIDILPYCTHCIFDSEIDLILYFLRFEKISKVPEILYYVQKSRLPYKECLNYCESPRTTNKLAIFNRNKILDNQSYFKEIITSKKNLSTYCIEYDSTIVTILNSVNIGGTEGYVINLANRLKKENIQLCILTNECFNKELFVFYDIPIYIFDLKNIDKFKNTLSIIPNIMLIQIHMDKDLYLCPMIKSILNVPIIFTIHGIYYSEKIIQSYSNYLDEIIFVSEYSKKYYSELLEKSYIHKYLVIPNGIEISNDIISKKSFLKKALGIDENSIILIYCSRLSYNKSKLALLFLESFKKVIKKNKNVFAIIAGNGNYALSIKNLCQNINKEFNDNNKVFFLGNKFNILSYYFESDLIIGTGRVAIEAMSLGKPVISFGSNGHVNIVDNSNIETLVDSNFGDHSFNPEKFNDELIINKLTEYINLLINSTENRKKLGLWNKSYIENYLTLDKITNFYLNECKARN